jgi:hypothetical protein
MRSEKREKTKKNFSDVVNSETSEFSDVSLFTTSKKFFFFFFSSLLFFFFSSLLFSSTYLVKNFV